MKGDCAEVRFEKEEEEDLQDSWGGRGRGQMRGRDGERMEVRGRWWKKAKDIMPNKKADGRFEVCGSARSAYACRRLLFPFSATQIDPV